MKGPWDPEVPLRSVPRIPRASLLCPQVPVQPPGAAEGMGAEHRPGQLRAQAAHGHLLRALPARVLQRLWEPQEPEAQRGAHGVRLPGPPTGARGRGAPAVGWAQGTGGVCGDSRGRGLQPGQRWQASASGAQQALPCALGNSQFKAALKISHASRQMPWKQLMGEGAESSVLPWARGRRRPSWPRRTQTSSASCSLPARARGPVAEDLPPARSPLRSSCGCSAPARSPVRSAGGDGHSGAEAWRWRGFGCTQRQQQRLRLVGGRRGQWVTGVDRW